MIKTSTECGLEVQKSLNNKSKEINICLLVIGAIGLLAYILLYTFLPNENVWINLLLVFSLPFVYGLINVLTINKLNKKSIVDKRLLEYEFDIDNFVVVESRAGEKIGEFKIYYKDLAKVRQTNNFLFLYTNRMNAFPIKKSNLSASDLNLIIKMVNFAKNNSKNKTNKSN